MNVTVTRTSLRMRSARAVGTLEATGFGRGEPMRAMVYRGPYKVRVEEKDGPRIGHPNDAVATTGSPRPARPRSGRHTRSSDPIVPWPCTHATCAREPAERRYVRPDGKLVAERARPDSPA